MHVSEIPHSIIVANAAAQVTLEVAFETILRREIGFTHSAPIEGAACTGRIFTVGAYQNFVPYAKPLNAMGTADMLRTMRWESQYHPVLQGGCERGWMVCQAFFTSRPAAIVWAVWLHAL